MNGRVSILQVVEKVENGGLSQDAAQRKYGVLLYLFILKMQPECALPNLRLSLLKNCYTGKPN